MMLYQLQTLFLVDRGVKMIMPCEIGKAGDERSHGVKVLIWYSLGSNEENHWHQTCESFWSMF